MDVGQDSLNNNGNIRLPGQRQRNKHGGCLVSHGRNERSGRDFMHLYHKRKEQFSPWQEAEGATNNAWAYQSTKSERGYYDEQRPEDSRLVPCS